MTLMNKRAVNVFKCPPIVSAAGHSAESWRGNQMWTGQCLVKSINTIKCKVSLVNGDGTVFAESVFEAEDYGRFVQRCVDSSRFFALLLVNE